MIKSYLHKCFEIVSIAATLFVAAILTGCNDGIVPDTDINSSGHEADVTVGIAIPDMICQNTRAFGNLTTSMKLTVFEFALGTDATNTFPTRTYQAEVVSQVAEGFFNFKIPNLVKTDEPRVLHFVIAPDYLSVPYGSEAAVFSALSVKNDTPVYWGRVEFPTGYADPVKDASGNVTGMTISDDVKQKFQDIPVIRNFAKISMEEDIANFNIFGFEIINVPTSGTVAPYNIATKSFADMLNDGGTMKSFSEITRGDTGYKGIMPANTSFKNTEEEAKSWTTGNGGAHPFYNTDKYLYEHPFESTKRTYVLVWGQYRKFNTGNASDWVEGYYKIDLGKTDEATKIFQYYDGIIRNIDYHITITGVSSEGYKTPAEAINGIAYNNISADVDTRNMLSISEGTNLLSVSKTTIVITKNEPIDFYYQYTTDLSKNSENKGNSNSTAKIVNFQKGAFVIGTTPDSGDVIASCTTPTEVTYQGDKWMKVTITPTSITDGVSKKQKFWIIDGDGLSREITLISHKPYDYVEKVVYPGQENEYTGLSNMGKVNAVAGQPFTVYFKLPAGMPEEIFPLTFTIESDRQNMENNPIGNLAVTSGDTYFPNTETYAQPTIKYEKTVSYLEYQYKYKEKKLISGTSNYDYTETNEIDMTKENTDHLVRCRFRTINSLADLPGSPTTTTTHVIIYNDYFNVKGPVDNLEGWPGIVKFTRTR